MNEFAYFTRRNTGLPVRIRLADISSYSGNHDGSTYVTMKNREGYALQQNFHDVHAIINRPEITD